MIHLRRSLLIGIVLFGAVATAQDRDYGVRTHQLKNGMRIIVQEDHSIPNVALYITYRIGSRNERPGTTGLSHFFEHMMFRGTKKYPDYDAVTTRIGAARNASTSTSVSTYVTRTTGWSMLWVAPVVWTALEKLWPEIFPNYLGASQYQLSHLTQIADLAGILGEGACAVNSRHHQCVDRVAGRLVVADRSRLASLLSLAVALSLVSHQYAHLLVGRSVCGAPSI